MGGKKMNFKNYIGKKIRIPRRDVMGGEKEEKETVKIKRLIEIDDRNFVPNPSYWIWKAKYETEDGRIVVLYYAPYAIGRRKEWVFEEDIEKQEEFSRWLCGEK
jgi:hypothetical protein